MKKWKKLLSMLLVMSMLLGLSVPADAADEAADAVSADAGDVPFYKIVHLDVARKYFSPEQIKTFIDNMADAGMNQLQLYFSDNQGFRLKLDDMTVQVNGNSYDLTPALGKGYEQTDKGMYPQDSDSVLTQAEMSGIIEYAAQKGIQIVPSINSPGHMGAILEQFPQFRYSNAAGTSNSSIDLTNSEAVAFAKAVVKKYIDYFAGEGVKFFNMGGDEYANDVSGMGFSGLVSAGLYDDFVAYLNDLAGMVTDSGMTPRLFNDGVYYDNHIGEGYQLNPDIQICYWSTNGDSRSASAATIRNQGHQLINTSKDLYYVVAKSPWICVTEESARNFSYERFADSSTLSDPAGTMMCIWCDDGRDTTRTSDAIINATKPIMKAYGGTLPSYERTITLRVGETAEINSDANDIDRTNLNEAIAGVSDFTESAAGYAEVTEIQSGDSYVLVNPNKPGVLTNTTTTNTAYKVNGSNANGLVFENGFSASGNYEDAKYQWTLTEKSGENAYTMQSGGKYLTIGNSYNGNNHVTLSDTEAAVTVARSGNIFTVSSGGAYLDTFTNTFVAAWSGSGCGPNSNNEQWKLYRKNSAYTAVVTGVQVGITEVTVGKMHYTIRVLPQEEQEIFLRISTHKVWDKNDGISGNNPDNHTTTVTLTGEEEGILTEEGADVAKLVPEDGSWQWAASDADGVATTYWKTISLGEGNHQSENIGEDKSMSGEQFTRIRYWEGSWQIKSADAWKNLDSTDELVAYYLQKTQITEEVTTYVKDWALTPSNASSQGDSNRYQKALSFAVVYPSGQINPQENDIYQRSTLIYWDNLENLGFIRFVGNDIYDVSKITYTLGERAASSQNNWGTAETINWNKTTIDSAQWYDETTVWTKEKGSEPYIMGSDIREVSAGTATGNNTGYDGTWGQDDAVLVLIYLEVAEKEDSLTVRYWDDSSDAMIYSYPIAVESGHNFKENLNPPVKYNVLDDDASITNIMGVDLQFEKNLTEIPALFGKYASGLYEYKDADVSEDGKTLTLHYTLNSEQVKKTYVLDFGRPVKVELRDLIENTEQIQSMECVQGQQKYGEVSVESDYTSFTYTPERIMNGGENVTVRMNFSDGTTVSEVIHFVPATTVYYEEGFLSYSDGWQSQGQTAMDGQSVQTTPVWGEDDYGYDANYANEAAGASSGLQMTSSQLGDSAEYSFSGTGTDIYANCTSSSGSMSVQVKNADTGRIIKLMIIDTKVGGEGLATSYQNDIDAAYSVPVANINLQEYGKYDVKIRHVVRKNGEDVQPVSIDGFRIYNPFDPGSESASSVYEADDERGGAYIEIRDQFLTYLRGTDFTSTDYKTLYEQIYNKTEGKSSAVIFGNTVSEDPGPGSISDEEFQDRLNNGPKNELYLREGETLAFKVAADLKKLQIGLKSVNAGVDYSISVGGQEIFDDRLSLTSSTEMYYKLAGRCRSSEPVTVSITNKATSGGVLSVTKLKIVGDYDIGNINEVSLAAFEEQDVQLLLEGLNPETKNNDRGMPFTDIADGDWYHDAVSYTYGRKLMTGLKQDIFGPADSIVRAQFAVILHRIESEPSVEAVFDFEDVAGDTWYTEAIRWANGSEIATGYTGTKLFGTNDAITREQMAVMMYRYAKYKGYDVTKTADYDTFEDASQVSRFAEDAMKWAVGNEIITGKDNGRILDPQGDASRAECADCFRM